MKRTLLAAWLLLGAALAQAATYSGSVADPTNTALVGSDLGAAQFADDDSIANNVAIYTLVVPVASLVTFKSTGYAAGGIDPYFTLFQGAGTGATFLRSNYDQAFSTGGDFTIAASLAAGTYQFSIGTFANLSFAENLGTGTLADGFTMLGTSYSLNNDTYAFDVTQTPGVVPVPVPEPDTAALLLLGLVAAGVWQTRRARPVR